METRLQYINNAKRQLAKAQTIDEVKTIRDKAEALRAYFKQAKSGLESQNAAAEIKIYAERRAGEILAVMDKQRPGEYQRLHDATVGPKLSELGIEKTQSHRWQRMAGIPEGKFNKYIAKTKDEGKELTSIGIVRLAKEQNREATRDENRALVASATKATERAEGKTYPTIIIDPPWDWSDEGDQDQYGRARPTYATMTIQQITDLPVAELSKKNAHLYLWITNRSLPKGFALLEAWGFRYVTCLTWCKPSFGMGNYYRGSTEHILFGVRGSLPLLRNDVGTWFEADRSKRHSAKPQEFYDLIETCSPGPWLEMFARNERPGWTTWGAEV